MMTGPRRQLAIAGPAQRTAQGLRADRDRELVPDPLRQIEQPPAHHAMRRRDRSVLDDLRQCPAVIPVRQWRRARRLAVDQTVGTPGVGTDRSEEHTYELQSLMRISYAVFCLQKQKQHKTVNKMNN